MFMLNSFVQCRNATHYGDDNFIGINVNNFESDYKIVITFPMGFHLDNSNLISDIQCLLKILSSYNYHANISKDLYDGNFHTNFPFESFRYVLEDYLQNGIYTEKNYEYRQGLSGSINFARTIKKEKPIYLSENIIYLQYQTKQNKNIDNNLMTLIHKYCIYKAITLFGWLYNIKVNPINKFDLDIEMAINYLTNQLLINYKDKERLLITAMLKILRLNIEQFSEINLLWGTDHFEYIWEKMIDMIFGIANKNMFFPHGYWLIEDKKIKSSALEPDTIMVNEYENSIAVLDAKYYKYGVTGNYKDLPSSSDINKQITYGQYIDTNRENLLDETSASPMKIFNSFIMPYNSKDNPFNINTNNILYTITATGDWKIAAKDKTYQYIHNILLDVKWLMTLKISEKYDAQDELLNCIQRAHVNLFK